MARIGRDGAGLGRAGRGGVLLGRCRVGGGVAMDCCRIFRGGGASLRGRVKE